MVNTRRPYTGGEPIQLGMVWVPVASQHVTNEHRMQEADCAVEHAVARMVAKGNLFIAVTVEHS